MTVTAARDLAQYGIRVVAIAPGHRRHPDDGGDARRRACGRWPRASRSRSGSARPEEYARLVLMVVAHDYLNGETIRMDGALRMGPR